MLYLKSQCYCGLIHVWYQYLGTSEISYEIITCSRVMKLAGRAIDITELENMAVKEAKIRAHWTVCLDLAVLYSIDHTIN